MNKLLIRAKHVIVNEDGASNIEIIVWISVVLVIATVLYLFRDAVTAFITKAIGKVNALGGV